MGVSKSGTEPLVYSRRQVREILGCSAALIRSLEAQGRLRPIALGIGLSRRGLRYRRDEVHALIRGEQSASENTST